MPKFIQPKPDDLYFTLRVRTISGEEQTALEQKERREVAVQDFAP